MFVDFQRQFRFQWLRVKPRGFGEGLIQQRLRDAVIADEIKANLGKGMAQFFPQFLKGSRRPGAQLGKIQNGNAVSHGK